MRLSHGGNRHQEARLDRASPRLPVQLAVAVAVGQPLAALLALGHARQSEAVSLSNHRIARHPPAKLLSNRAGRLSRHPKALQQLRSRLVPLRAHAELLTSITRPSSAKVSLRAPSPLWFQTS